jgi:hypothetical protein
VFGFEAFEPKAKAVALPIQNLHSVSRLVEEHEKHRVKHRDLDVQFDQSREVIDGFSEVDGLGVEIDFCVGAHHEVLAPEKNREHSIGDQVMTLNVGFMERLLIVFLLAALRQAPGLCIDYLAVSYGNPARR